MLTDDLIQAVTGGSTDPRDWRLGYLESLLSTLESGEYVKALREDPTAVGECLRESRALATALRAALAPLAERQREEVVRAEAAVAEMYRDGDVPL